MHRFNWQPSDRTLKQFAGFGMLVLGLVAGPWLSYRGHTTAAVAFWLAAIALGSAAWLNPRLLKWPFVGASLVSWPIGWALSYIALAVLYYLIITPIAVVFWLIGRDPLDRQLDRQADSYWTAYDPDRGAERYLRQF